RRLVRERRGARHRRRLRRVMNPKPGIYEAMRERRSVRRFKSDPVSREIVTSLIEAAITAPSASNKQPWRFLVVEDRARIEKMAAAVREATAKVSAHIPEASQP